MTPTAAQHGAGAGRIGRAYRYLATTGVTLLCLLVAANLIAAAVLGLGWATPPPGALSYGTETLSAVYPGWSEPDLRQLLTEAWTRPYAYEPFTQFKEAPFAGRFLNVLPEGFRSSGRPQAWPPAPQRRGVFFFGGSTGFGYGLPDDRTLPRRLEDLLRAEPACGAAVEVYNFARSNYYSSQELALFARLLAAGRVPDLAIFFDGLNEFGYREDEPKFTARLRYLMAESTPQLWRRAVVGLPLAVLLKRMRREAATGEEVAAGVRPQEIVDRYLRNGRLIGALARSFGVEVLFAWQPVPFYGFEGRHRFWGPAGPPQDGAIADGYRLLAARRGAAAGGDEESILWLADLPQAGAPPAYVDRVHYSEAFTERIAARMAGPAARRLCPPAAGAAGGPAP